MIKLAAFALSAIWNMYQGQLKKHIAAIVQAILNKSALLAYFNLNRDILIRTLCLEICFVFITFQGARLGDNIVAANAILMNFVLLI